MSKESLEQKLDVIRRQVTEKTEKWANKVQVSTYVTPPEPTRAVGDVWTDADGVEWTMGNFGKTKSTSLLFQELRMPWFCPKCQNAMNHHFDNKCWAVNKICYKCMIMWETQLRIDGKWEAHEKKQQRENEKAFLRDKIEERRAYINEFKVPTVYFENGGYEVLAKLEVFKDMLDSVREDLQFCEDRLATIEAEDDNG